MRRSLRAALVAAALVAGRGGVAPASATTPPRQDSYIEIWCQTPEGPQLWKRVDSRSVDSGNLQISIDRFNANNPYGEFCQIGPFG